MADVHAQGIEAEHVEEPRLAGTAPPMAPAETPGQPVTPVPTTGSGAPGAGVVNPSGGAMTGGGRPSA